MGHTFSFAQPPSGPEIDLGDPRLKLRSRPPEKCCKALITDEEKYGGKTTPTANHGAIHTTWVSNRPVSILDNIKLDKSKRELDIVQDRQMTFCGTLLSSYARLRPCLLPALTENCT